MPIIHPDDPIRLLVSLPPATIDPAASLADVADQLDRDGVGALAVMEGDRLGGVVSERDLVRALALRSNPGEMQAGDLMAANPVRVDMDDPIAVAATRMLDEGVRHLPVIDGGELVGVVSIREVLRVFADEWLRSAR